MNTIFTRLTTLILILMLIVNITGCFGRFPITRAVYKFNDSIASPGDDAVPKIAEQVVFWAFIIFPVYSLSTLGDAVIFNLIEFWSGEPLDFSSAPSDSSIMVADAGK